MDIKKQLKSRDKINLQAIVNRSFVEETSSDLSHQFRSRRKHVQLDVLKNGNMTARLSDIVEGSSTSMVKENSGFNSTA